MAVSTVEYDYEPVSDTGMGITHFRVDESERRHGVGTAVMRALLARFAADGYRYVVVNMRGGDAARRFLTGELGMTLVEGPNPDGFVTAEIELRSTES